MDSTQLERGTLEGKDRDELTTIANALGGKPGSRARKAEIVDLILDKGKERFEIFSRDRFLGANLDRSHCRG